MEKAHQKFVFTFKSIGAKSEKFVDSYLAATYPGIKPELLSVEEKNRLLDEALLNHMSVSAVQHVTKKIDETQAAQKTALINAEIAILETKEGA